VVTSVQARIAEIKSGLESPRYLPRMRTLLGTNPGSIRFEGDSARRSTSIPRLSALRGLPAPLVQPVARLATAVADASEIMGRVPPTFVRHIVEDAIASTVRRSSARLSGPAALGAPNADAVARKVASRAGRAALIIAAAMDRSLPSLRAWSGRAESGDSVAGCDLLDQTPYLCVGSDVDNRYTSSESLLIDLGGNDTYAGSAGGAVAGPDANDVSVNIDLGGDDTYEAETAEGDPLVVQGAAVGAVGMLVDEGGDDTYTARGGLVVAQGAGLFGVGALFDDAGSDSFDAQAVEVQPGASNAVYAQGSGYFCGAGVTEDQSAFAGCGVGALVAAGESDDSYRMTAGGTGSTPDGNAAFLSWGGTSAVFGQGFCQGVVGMGLLSDGGGADSFVASANVDAAPDGSPTGFPQVWAQASSLGCTGALLEGSGPTTYTASQRTTGWTKGFYRTTVAQAGADQGNAFLEDLGGDDVYRTVFTGSDRRSLRVDDSCDCGQASAKAASWTTETGDPYNPTYQIQSNFIIAQAGTMNPGVAILLDHGGNDTYTIDSDNELNVSLHDELTAPEQAPDLHVLGYQMPFLGAQGGGLSGVSVLIDDQGTDTYDLNLQNRTDASATSDHATGIPDVVATAPWGPTLAWAQGGGQGGALLDLGGADDRLSASSNSLVSTSPDPDGAFRDGWDWPDVQGSGGGTLVVVGQDPVLTRSPSAAGVCGTPGARGYGVWTTCVPTGSDPGEQTFSAAGGGNGLVPLAPTAAAPSLRFTADTPVTAVATDEESRLAPRIEVGATLHDGVGNAVPGAIVHLMLQYCVGGESPAGGLLCDGPTGMSFSWTTLWQVDAATGADGVARALIPAVASCEGICFKPGVSRPFRLLAAFDGRWGSLYPEYVAQTIDLVAP
jgi:hypothetical protein